MKTNLIGLAVAAAVMTSFSAFADDRFSDHSRHHHAAGSSCDVPQHGATPVATAQGRYELQNVQKWVEARYENVTVQQCVGRGRHHRGRVRCFDVVETRLVPGSYQTVQEWVWVATQPQHHRYSNYPSTPPPMYGGTGFSVGFNVGSR